MLLGFLTLLRLAPTSHSMATCQQNVKTATLLLRRKRGKWKYGGEPSRVKSHQCFHVVLIREKGRRKVKQSNAKERR